MWKGLTASTNLGCATPLTVPAAGGVALAKFTGAGACVWNKLLALPTGAVKAQNFRLGADGSMLAAVVYSGSIDFGGGNLTSSGTTSLALAEFDSNGTLQWTKNFGVAGSSFTIGSVGANASGSVILSAGYAGSVNLGAGALPANNDTFLALFDSGGNLKWSKTVTMGTQGALLAFAAKCGLVLATNSPTVDLGTGPLSMVQGSVDSIGVAALGL